MASSLVKKLGSGCCCSEPTTGSMVPCPTSSHHRAPESMNRRQRRRRLEHGCRACCRWPWSARLNSDQMDPLHYAAGNTRETSTR